MIQSFAGRTALVTGAGSAEGIGFAIARRLHRAGASVAITSTTQRIQQRAGELDAAGVRVWAAAADLTDPAQVRGLVRDVAGRFGAIHVLVNNAGMAQTGRDVPFRTVEEMNFEDWKRQIEISLYTAFLTIHEVLPGMLERGYGRIVNISSVTGPLVSNVGSAAYGAAKAGLDGMMRAVALETAAKGITINAVAPGWIATASTTAPERIAGRHTPLGRCGTPDEVAAAACFLASEDASYITGQALVVDGGNVLQEKKVSLPDEG